jgi:hypothetical protein
MVLPVEQLSNSEHAGMRIRLTYPGPYTAALVPVDGRLVHVTHGHGFTNLMVDRLFYAVPAGMSAVLG